MLDFDTTFELMKKYGYSSTVHPYIYQNGESIGLCYSYIDEDFGTLERIKLFEDADTLEDFLKKLDWVKVNGKKYHVRMALDNYESINPKVMFLRNEKIMVEGEMFDIDNYDYRESQRLQMDDVSKVIYEAGDLLLVYDEMKGRQLQYLKSIVRLKNKLRQKYFDLQTEVDKYNKYKVERALVLLPEVADIGINEMLEINIKDRYNMYVTQRPTYEEAVEFLKEVWELNKSLELNVKYYEALKEENDVRNELKVVEQKLSLMQDLNDNYKPLFGVDLVGKFRKINRVCKKYSNTISDSFISENINTINRKYAVFNDLDILFTSDYLREAIQNTNYADLAIKYSKDKSKQEVKRSRKPLNEVASSLSLQYRDKLDSDEQAILVLYNNHKYRKLCNAILQLDNFDTLPIKKVISKINGIKGFSKIKSECYDVVKRRLEDPINQKIKTMLFRNYDFTTFDSFISSLIKELVRLKNVNNKMVINGDINMYLIVNKVEDVEKDKFLVVTNSLNSLLIETKDTNKMIGITLLKENSPVLYSPYYFDVGDIYSKNASLQMSIKEMVDFELLIDTSDILINVDPFRTNVVRYYSEPNAIDNILVVNDLKMNYKTTFCKFAFTSNLEGVLPQVNNVVVESQPVTSNQVVVTEKSEGLKEIDAGVISNPVLKNNNEKVDNKVVNNISNPVKEKEPIIKQAPVVEKKEIKADVSNVKVDADKNVTPVTKTLPVTKKVEPSAKPVLASPKPSGVVEKPVVKAETKVIPKQEMPIKKADSNKVLNNGEKPKVIVKTNTVVTSPDKGVAAVPAVSQPVANKEASQPVVKKTVVVNQVNKGNNQDNKGTSV